MSPLADLEPARLLDFLLSSPPVPLALVAVDDDGWEAMQRGARRGLEPAEC